AMGDAIWLLPIPLGVSAFVKGGSIDTPGFHAVCVPGGMLFENRWVFFSIAINWDSPAETDPATVNAFLAAGSHAVQLVKDSLPRTEAAVRRSAGDRERRLGDDAGDVHVLRTQPTGLAVRTLNLEHPSGV